MVSRIFRPRPPTTTPRENRLRHPNISDQSFPWNTTGPHRELRSLPIITEEVVYFEQGTHCLQVMPRAILIPLYNYKAVEKLWGYVIFDLINVGANGYLMALPCYRKIENGNRDIATLHWNDGIPFELRYAKRFWVGPID